MKAIRVSVEVNNWTKLIYVEDNAIPEEINKEAQKAACEMIDYCWECEV